jgi:hypothetical protein
MPPNGYIWSLAHTAGHRIRSFGYLGVNKPLNQVGSDGIHIQDVLDPILKPNTDFRYRDYALEYRDIDRAKVFLEDLAEHEKKANGPTSSSSASATTTPKARAPDAPPPKPTSPITTGPSA